MAEGSQPTAESSSEHLRDCPTCQSDLDTLSQLLTVLATLERPQLPHEVALRIDAALAREAAERAPTTPAEEDASSSRSVRARGRVRFSRGLGWAMAALATTAGGVVLAANLTSSGSSAGRASAGSAAPRPYQKLDNNGARRAEGTAGSPEVLAPSTPLAVWVKQALAGMTPRARINSPCISDPTFGSGQPLAVVNGDYSAVPAVLVVYALVGDPSTVRAVVYAQPCTPQNYQVLAQGLVVK
ncbi:hypothetical protein KGA66_03650 [Actinocrinis puniceicyclus]|uniref:Uncharacterized protein n=1 Tax=Actinocrinis puniceicyclus TaxID=977794 RepID=A0A8J7WL60_9ACTN|nr:hypothetical protein [Actinocrinis puniceicyclus]MBS2962127.1 hypothetical protein [Actinocrinis puniceicyclus]